MVWFGIFYTQTHTHTHKRSGAIANARLHSGDMCWSILVRRTRNLWPSCVAHNEDAQEAFISFVTQYHLAKMLVTVATVVPLESPQRRSPFIYCAALFFLRSLFTDLMLLFIGVDKATETCRCKFSGSHLAVCAETRRSLENEC